MDTCTVETGLLRKKPCGHPAVTHCATCEQGLCKDHAVAQLSGGKKTGKFMCKECDVAHREFEKNLPPAVEKKAAAAPAQPAAHAAKPAAPAAKAAAPAAAKPGAAPAAKPAEEKKVDDDAPLEFTPSKPPAPKK